MGLLVTSVAVVVALSGAVFFGVHAIRWVRRNRGLAAQVGIGVLLRDRLGEWVDSVNESPSHCPGAGSGDGGEAWSQDAGDCGGEASD